jgi:hypothetical protein
LGLLDPAIVSTTGNYVYEISPASVETLQTEFDAVATRTGGTGWAGMFTINEMGEIDGVIAATGQRDITPGFQ